MFVTIPDPKKRDRIVEDYIKTKNRVKQKSHEEKLQKEGYVEETEKLFKPVTKAITEKSSDTDKIIESQEKILEQVKQLPSTKMLPALPSSSSSHEEILDTGIIVSKLIARYLQNKKGVSNATYSMRYSEGNDAYVIGNKLIHIDHNIMTIAGKKYEATEGLMELLTKTKPNEEIYTNEDLDSYKNIIIDTDGIYQDANRNAGKVVSNNSPKWKLIKKLLPDFIKQRGGSLMNDTPGGVTFLPENADELVNQLRLSLASWSAGNNGEFNKINAILDELLRTNIISKNDFIKIYRKHF